jgi:hypothetical protein
VITTRRGNIWTSGESEKGEQLQYVGDYCGKKVYRAEEEVSVLMPDWRGRFYLWHIDASGRLTSERIDRGDPKYALVTKDRPLPAADRESGKASDQ